MPRQNREAPGCYVPSGGLSHYEILPISDTYCCPKSCRSGAGRIRFAGTTATCHSSIKFMLEQAGVLGGLSTRTNRRRSTRLHLHTAQLNLDECGANLRIKVVERGHFLDAGHVARLPLA